MNLARKKRLILMAVIAIILCIAVALILTALRQNINLFFTPSEIVQNQVPSQHTFRLGGMVEKGSVKHQLGLDVSFVLTDFKSRVQVHYQGILPDLFREGQGIVAMGHMQGKTFRATQVLAKHDENYMPNEIKHLKQQQKG